MCIRRWTAPWRSRRCPTERSWSAPTALRPRRSPWRWRRSSLNGSADGWYVAAVLTDTGQLALHDPDSSGTDASADFLAPRKARVHVQARRLAPGLPHAQHIHFGEQARNECPVAADAGPDHQLTTSDGAPAYGPVVTSLTTRGDTTPAGIGRFSSTRL